MKRFAIAFLLICSTCFSQTMPSWNQLRSTFKDTITQAKINATTAKITKLAILDNPKAATVFRMRQSGVIFIPYTPEYSDNVAAKAAGLVDGDVYHTAGALKIVVP